MDMRKKAGIIFLCGLCVLIIAISVLYSKKYTIQDNKKQLEQSLAVFIHKGTAGAPCNTDIKQELNLDNKKYVLFTSGGDLCNGELTKGLNNKYKIIEVTTSNNQVFRFDIYKTSKSKYLIFYGKSAPVKIAYIKTVIDNKEYKVIMPQQEYFIAYCPIPVETKAAYPDINKMKFYDSKDNDITAEVTKSMFT